MELSYWIHIFTFKRVSTEEHDSFRQYSYDFNHFLFPPLSSPSFHYPAKIIFSFNDVFKFPQFYFRVTPV